MADLQSVAVNMPMAWVPVSHLADTPLAVLALVTMLACISVTDGRTALDDTTPCATLSIRQR